MTFSCRTATATALLALFVFAGCDTTDSSSAGDASGRVSGTVTVEAAGTNDEKSFEGSVCFGRGVTENRGEYFGIYAQVTDEESQLTGTTALLFHFGDLPADDRQYPIVSPQEAQDDDFTGTLDVNGAVDLNPRNAKNGTLTIDRSSRDRVQGSFEFSGTQNGFDFEAQGDFDAGLQECDFEIPSSRQ